jgi:CoA:oxalate CoA-transferase
VLDLTLALAGPFATFLLAGLGAQVIKIENPESADPCRSNPPYAGRDGIALGRRHPDDVSISALSRLRGKLGVTLNLKRPGARDVFADLVRQSDVLVENFSAGALDRLGVGYGFAHAINPRLIYCSISGFGADKATGGGKAMDTIIQALSGLMMTSGDPGDPPVRVGVPFADLVPPVFGIVGILAAMHQRAKTGIGQHVDISMLGVLTSLVVAEPFDMLEACGVPQRTGRTVPRLAPFGVYETSDGFVAICAPTETFAANLFAAMQRPDLAQDPRFATRDNRVLNVEALNTIIEDFTRTQTNAALVARLESFGVPAAEVRTPREAGRDWRVRARGETVTLPHPAFGDVGDVIGMGVPITFSDASTGFTSSAPTLGEHNDLVYGRILGYSDARIAELRSSGVI